MKLTGSVHNWYLRRPSRTTQGTNCQTSLFVLVLLQLLFIGYMTAAASQPQVLEDLQTLAVAFPGSYRKVTQLHKHFRRELRHHKRHFLTRTDILKLATPMFNDSVTFYFQDFAKDRITPIRSGFYSFSSDISADVIRMKTFNLKHGLHLDKNSHVSLNLTIGNDVMTSQSWAISQMKTDNDCDMLWRRLRDNTYVAVTGSICLMPPSSSQIRVVLSITLTGGKLVLTEGWYQLSLGARLKELHISYIFRKLSVKDTTKVSRAIANNSGIHNVSNYVITPDKNVKVVTSKPPSCYDGASTETKQVHKKRGRRTFPNLSINQNVPLPGQTILADFRHIVTALMSGYKVYFRIDLFACFTAARVKIEKSYFGGKINNFMIVRNAGRIFLHFLSQKKIAGDEGIEFMSRNVTIRDDGRVKVLPSLSVYTNERRGQGYECWLDTGYGGSGGVVIFLNPTRKEGKVRSHSSYDFSDHDLTQLAGRKPSDRSR